MASNSPSLDNLVVPNHSDNDFSHPATMSECNTSPRELLSIPAELREKIYQFYFGDVSFTLHACPNSDYTFQNGKTSHDFIFPRCPKSLKETSDDIDTDSGKNILLVNKQVKNEAYKLFISESLFVLDEATCMTNAMFLQYKPIKNVLWMMDEPNVAGILKLAAITKQYADRCALKWFGSSWCLNIEKWNHGDVGVELLLMMGAILSSVRTINTEVASLEFVRWREPKDSDEADDGAYDGEDEDEIDDEVAGEQNDQEDDGGDESVVIFQHPTKDPASWNMMISVYDVDMLSKRLLPGILFAQTKPNEYAINGSVRTLVKPAVHVVHGVINLKMDVRHDRRVNGVPVPHTRLSRLTIDADLLQSAR